MFLDAPETSGATSTLRRPIGVGRLPLCAGEGSRWVRTAACGVLRQGSVVRSDQCGCVLAKFAVRKPGAPYVVMCCPASCTGHGGSPEVAGEADDPTGCTRRAVSVQVSTWPPNGLETHHVRVRFVCVEGRELVAEMRAV